MLMVIFDFEQNSTFNYYGSSCLKIQKQRMKHIRSC